MLEGAVRRESHNTLRTRLELASLVEFSNDAIISTNPAGIITTWNKGAEKVYGYSEDEVIGQHISFLAGPDMKKDFQMIQDKILRGDQVIGYETIRKTRDGKIINVSLTVSPVKNNSGEITGIPTVLPRYYLNKIWNGDLLSNEILSCLGRFHQAELLEKAVN